MDQNTRQKLTQSQKKVFFRLGGTIFLTVAASIVFFFTMYKMSHIGTFFSTVFDILQPITFGLGIAYILLPAVNGIEKRLKSFSDHRVKNRKKQPKIKFRFKNLTRSSSVFISIAFLLIIIYILGNMILPELYNTIAELAKNLPAQIKEFTDSANRYLKNNQNLVTAFEEALTYGEKYISTWINDNLLSKINTWIGYFALRVKDFVGIVANLIIGIIVAIYVLNSKETFTGQAKKLLYAFAGTDKANIIVDTVRQSHKIFSGFISGKLLDSFIVGVILFVVMSIFKMPYAMLISIIVGVTNIIPFFGPFIGAIPSIILMLLVSPWEALYLLIIIFILQQFDGNILGPKILGQSTGLAPFWVIFSILIGGGLFGFAGMLLGVPTFGVIYYITKRIVEFLLKKKNLPVDSAYYVNIYKLSSETIKTPSE
ncbi:MAG: AI-2E family transporter [Clostridia bacterium]|nr:AI-2E family transporter [Clostridia bacterium]